MGALAISDNLLQRGTVLPHEGDHGWKYALIAQGSAEIDVHVYPMEERDHIGSMECICKPWVGHEYGEAIIYHRARDGRENGGALQ